MGDNTIYFSPQLLYQAGNSVFQLHPIYFMSVHSIIIDRLNKMLSWLSMPDVDIKQFLNKTTIYKYLEWRL